MRSNGCMIGALALVLGLAGAAVGQSHSSTSKSSSYDENESVFSDDCAGDGCGCDSGCDSCQSCCPPAGIGLGGGFEALFLTANSNDLNAFYTQSAANRQATQPFDFDLDFNTRVWVECVSLDGLGFRARFFNYNDNAARLALDNNSNPNFIGHDVGESSDELFMDVETATGETFVARTSLGVTTWDGEATQQLDLEPLFLTVAGGVRYVRTHSDYSGTILDAALARTGEALFIRNAFEGLGPTLALEARREMLWGLSLLASMRGTVAFGRGNLNAVEVNAGGVVAETFTARRDDGLYMAELLLGVEWSQEILGSRFFARATYESQSYTNFGLATKLGDINEGSTLFLHGFGGAIGICR